MTAKAELMIFHFVPLVFVAIIDKLFKETVCRLSVDVFSVVLKMIR